MSLNSRSKPDNACRAQDHVLDKGKSEQRGEERSRHKRYRIVDEERERSEKNEKSPERSEDDPSYALRCGDDLNVAEIESLVALD